ncbi:hypothetical protein CVT26_005615 [Gymnopilus dilepis]|uniref:Uncharacterized protein n=1 Tax=Gymnopilus dilepis TaxID=231916 RepID=A0A409XZK4_9AGAR|nr:hypothetical protein CVT26_005615 [Gymnopilus dilepis]
MRNRKFEARESADTKLVEALLNALTGTATSRPRQKTPFNAWRKTQRTLIDERVKSIAEKQGIASDHLVALRLNVGREMFDGLSAQEKEYWKSQAKLESEEELQQWKLRNSDPSVETDDPPNSAKDCQFAILALVRVAKAVVDCIEKTTGWKATLIAGGPEPAREGRINIMSIHAGKTSGEARMDFVGALGPRYPEEFVSCFRDFLDMCYSPEDRQKCALNPGAGYLPLGATRCDERLYIHPFGVKASTVKTLQNIELSSSKEVRIYTYNNISPVPVNNPSVTKFDSPHFHALSSCASILEGIFHRRASVTILSSDDGTEDMSSLLSGVPTNANRPSTSTPRLSRTQLTRAPVEIWHGSGPVCPDSPESWSSTSAMLSTPEDQGPSGVRGSIRASPPLQPLLDEKSIENRQDHGRRDCLGQKSPKRMSIDPSNPVCCSPGWEDKSSRPLKRRRSRKFDVAFLLESDCQSVR